MVVSDGGLSTFLFQLGFAAAGGGLMAIRIMITYGG